MATALYIEYPRITAVELVGNARKPRVKRVCVGALPEARNEDGTPIADKQGHLNKHVANFIKEHKLRSGKFYLLIGPEGMRYRDLHLAFSDRRQIERVLQFQVEGVIPNVPIEEMALGYNVLGASAEGAHLLVHAADKDYVRTRITALEEAGLSVEGADSHLSGTINLGMLHPEFADDTPATLWLDFAGTIATVAEVSEGKINGARVFLSPYLAGASGGTAGATGVKEAARTAQEEAEVRAREFLGGEEGATLPASDSVNMGEQEVAGRIQHMSRDELQKFLGRVAVEAKRTLLMSNLEVEPQRLIISGLGKAGDEIATALGAELGLQDARAIELMDAVGRDGKDDKPLPDLGELSYLTGVGLKGIGRDYTRINFRYGDLAPGTLFDYAKTPLAFTATLALLFGGILFLMSFTHSRNYEQLIADLRDGDGGRSPKSFYDGAFKYARELEIKAPDYPQNVEDPAQEIRSTHKVLKDRLNLLQGQVADNYKRPHPADEIIVAVLKAIQDAGPSYDFALVGVTISPRLMRVEYYVSLSETEAEQAKLNVPAVYRNAKLNEEERMLASMGAMVEKHPDWFEAKPRQTKPGNPLRNSEGREAQLVDLSFPLKDPKAPPSRTTAKGARK